MAEFVENNELNEEVEGNEVESQETSNVNEETVEDIQVTDGAGMEENSTSTEEEVVENTTPADEVQVTDGAAMEEDNEDTIKDEIEQPFYATVPEFDELRDVLSELDYRLFLINDNLVVIGRLNGADIEILINNELNRVITSEEFELLQVASTLNNICKSFYQ